MATLQEQLEQSIQTYNENANKVHAFINGTDTETIASDSGEKPTIAKIVKDTEVSIDNSLTELKDKIGQVSVDKTAVEQIKSETAQIKSEAENLLDDFEANQLPILNQAINQNAQNISDNLTKIEILENAITSGFENIKSINGYTKLPNGLIIQWGRVDGELINATRNFPIAFPNSCLAMAGANQKTSSWTYEMCLNPISKTQFKVLAQHGGYSTWIAIGY